MKVLFVDHEAECGGAEESLLDLLGALDRTRCTPVVACSPGGPLAARARALGVAVHAVPMAFWGRARKAWGLARAATRLARLVRREGVSIVHTNTMIAGYCGLLAARLAGVRCVWHVRDLGYPLPARWAAGRADVVVANSRATRASLTGAAWERSVVVYNGLDAAFFRIGEADRERTRRALGVSSRTRLVGMVGRLDPWKGHDVFLRAAARVAQRERDVRFLIAGDVVFDAARRRHAGYRARLEALVRDLALGHRVRFLGRRDDVPALLAGLDVFVHPSVRPEPFGRAVAEAQAAGVPVVASRCGGIPEILEHERTGLLVPPGDPEALAGAIGALLGDPDRAATMARSGRTAAERFCADRHARALEAVYTALPPPCRAAGVRRVFRNSSQPGQ